MSRKFGEDLQVSVADFLEDSFSEKQEILLDSVNSTREDEFIHMARNAVSSLVQNASGAVMGAKEAIEDRLNVAKKKLVESRTRESALQQKLYLSQKEQGNVRTPFLYNVLFWILEAGAVMVFFGSISYLFPGLPGPIAAVPALVMLIPSFSIWGVYERVLNKERYHKWVALLAMFFGFASVIAFSVLMTLVSMSDTEIEPTDNFLSSDSSQGSSSIELGQIMASITTLVMIFLAENLFAGTLKIRASRVKEDLNLRKNLKDDLLPKVEAETRDLEDQYRLPNSGSRR